MTLIKRIIDYLDKEIDEIYENESDDDIFQEVEKLLMVRLDIQEMAKEFLKEIENWSEDEFITEMDRIKKDLRKFVKRKLE